MKKLILLSLIFYFAFSNCSYKKSPLPPSPTQINDKEEEKDRTARVRWLEAMHRVAPGVSWRALEQRNDEIYFANRPALQLRGENEIFADGEIEGRWIERGSNNNAGCVNAMAVDTTADRLYAIGCGGTLFSSLADGSNWQVVNPNKRFVSSDLLIENYDSISRMFALDFQGQVTFSDDRGVSWNNSLGLPLKQDFWGGARNLTVDISGDSLVLYCMAKPSYWDGMGLYVSTNGGQDWLLKEQLSNGADEGYYTLANSIKKQDIFLFRGDSDQPSQIEKVNLQKPNDTITTIEDFDVDFISLAIAERDSQTWMYTYDINDTLWVYKPDSTQWNKMGALTASPWDVGIFPHPTDTSVLLMGAVNLHISRDGGRTWEIFSEWWEYYDDIENFIHADIMAFEPYLDQDENLRVLVSNHGGISLSDAGFRHMKNIGLTGLNVGQFYDVASDPLDPNWIYGGTQDQGFQRGQIDPDEDIPIAMEQTISGDYGKIVFSEYGQRMWTVYPGGDFSYYNDPKQGYVDDWETIDSENEHVWMPAMMASPDSSENAIYVGGGSVDGGAGSFIIKLTADANTLEVEAENLPFDFFNANSGGQLTSLAFSSVDTSRWYAATENGSFFFSADSGINWRQTQFLPSGSYLYGAAIFASTADPKVVYYGGSGYSAQGMYKSTNGGISFRPMNDGLPPTLVLDLEATPNDEYVFAATEAGPFVYSSLSEKWYPLIGAETPLTDWWSVEYLEEENIVRFGTFGRGIWDLKIDNMVVGVEELAASSFKIYPNPASTYIKIEDDSPSPFSIYTLDGKLIYQSTEYQKQVDVSSFEKGIYLVTKDRRSEKLVIH